MNGKCFHTGSCTAQDATYTIFLADMIVSWFITVVFLLDIFVEARTAIFDRASGLAITDPKVCV
jgi:hypothetical protein